MAINQLRVLKAGIAAGIVIIVSGVAMVPVVGDQMQAALKNRGLPPIGYGAMLYFALHSLVLGLVIVWLYAALQARFGQGLRTALVVSALVWFLAYFSANAAMVAYGFLPLILTAVGTAWGLVELLLAGTVGARIYGNG